MNEEDRVKDQKRIVLEVGGMSCTNCALTIEKALNKLEGVHNANVNFATGKATVEYYPEQVGISEIKKAIQKTGYAVIEGKKALGEEKEIRRQKYLFLFSLALSIPILIISMFTGAFAGKTFLLFALASPVQFIAGYKKAVGYSGKDSNHNKR